VKGLLTNHDDIVGPWVVEKTGGFWLAGSGTTVGLVDDQKGLIAGILYQDYNGANVSMHIAAEPGARWMTREFLWAAFHYPFEQLKCKRVTGLVADTNLVARRFDEHLGFSLEATLKDAHIEGDLLVYVMHKKDCRWLHLNRRGYDGEPISSY
jgi:RimJ/RimL family protein N-acetyltransferase